MSRPDETKIIDRDSELQIFARLVTMTCPRRVMVVSGRSGTGKTDLLRKFRLHCERDYTIPVALVHLTDFAQRQDEFAVVACMHKALKETGASLPNFEELDKARGFRNTLAFLERLRIVEAALDMRNATVSGAAKVAAMMFNVENAENVVLPEWSDEQDAQARALCVEAFLSDLNTYTQQHAVVLLLDGLDEVGEALRRWVLMELIKRCTLADWENRKLIVAVAGEDVQDMVYGRLPAPQHSRVELVSSFEEWDLTQVRNFLTVHGFGGLNGAEVTAIHTLLGGGYTLADCIFFATGIVERRRAA